MTRTILFLFRSQQLRERYKVLEQWKQLPHQLTDMRTCLRLLNKSEKFCGYVTVCSQNNQTISSFEPNWKSKSSTKVRVRHSPCSCLSWLRFHCLSGGSGS